MKKRLLLFLVLLILPTILMGKALAQEPPEVTSVPDAKVPISVIVREGCAHCHDEIKFLEDLQTQRNDFEVFYYHLKDTFSYYLFEEITTKEGISKVTPLTLVGNKIVVGFGDDQTTGKVITDLLEESKGLDTLKFDEYLEKRTEGNSIASVDEGCDEQGCDLKDGEFIIVVPFIGPVDLRPYSLPTISIVLGFVDGFNPCAMWVLVTFLLVLIQIGNRKRMWQIASLFILAESVMYYFILVVWFTAWDFVGLDGIISPLVGLVAVGGGLFFLYEGIKSDGTCKVTNVEQRQKISSSIKKLAAMPMTWVTAVGVIALAFSVNIIEFACSIGIPQAFTKIIELNNLGFWQTQGMMGLYILFYMIDDLLVFGLALWGSEKLHLTTKYSKYCNLIGGVLMITLGILLIFAPDVLRF